jgi:anti-sigma factor ChrR (cupin superfamily)
MRNTYLASEDDYFGTAPEGLEDSVLRSKSLGFSASVFQLGEVAADNPPAVLMLYIPPGGVLFRHRHDCFRLEVIVQGSLMVEDGRWLGPGDVRLSKPGEFYGPHTAGPTGVLAAEVFSSTTGLSSEMDPDLPPEHAAILKAARARRAAGEVG